MRMQGIEECFMAYSPLEGCPKKLLIRKCDRECEDRLLMEETELAMATKDAYPFLAS